MGYEVHIQRRNNYKDFEEDSNILENEWKQLVENDEELTWNEYDFSDNTTNFEYCYWLKHPELEENNKPWFQFYNGDISTKWTDTSCLYKLLSMAQKLNAKLFGDDGEEYTATEIKELENYHSKPTILEEKKKPFWKFW